MNTKSRWIQIRGVKIAGIICRWNPDTNEIEVKKGRVVERVKLTLDNESKPVYNESNNNDMSQ